MKKYTYISPTERVKVYFYFCVVACYQTKGRFGWITRMRRFYSAGLAVDPSEEIKKAYKTKFKSSTKITHVPTFPGFPTPAR